MRVNLVEVFHLIKVGLEVWMRKADQSHKLEFENRYVFLGKCQPQKVFFVQTVDCKEIRHNKSLEFSVLGTDRVMKPIIQFGLL